MDFGARLIKTPVFSSVKWVAGIWQYPPHRVGVKITEAMVAQPEAEGPRPSGTCKDKPLGPHGDY